MEKACNQLYIDIELDQPIQTLQLSINEASQTFQDISSTLCLKTSQISSSDFLTVKAQNIGQLQIPLHNLIKQRKLQLKQKIGNSQMKINLKIQQDLPSRKEPCKKCSQLEKILSDSPTEASFLQQTRQTILELATAMALPQNITPGLTTEELALDIQDLTFRAGHLNQSQAQHLRVLIVGLNQKLKLMDLLQQRLKKTQTLLSENQIAREDLQNSIQDTLEDIKQDSAQRDKLHQKLIEQRNQTKKELDDQIQLYREKCLAEQNLKCQINLLKAEFEQVKIEVQNFQRMKRQIEDLQQQITQADKARDALKAKYFQSIDAFQARNLQMDSEMQEIIQKNQKLGKEITEAYQTIQSWKNKSNALQNEIILSKSNIESLQHELKVTKDQAARVDQMEKLAHTHQQQCIKLHTQIQYLTQQFTSTLQSFQQQKRDLLQKIKLQTQTTKEIQNQNLVLKQEISNNKIQISRLQAKLSVAQEHLCLQQDTLDILSAIQNIHQLNQVFIQAYYKQMEKFSDSYLELSLFTLQQQRVLSLLSDTLSTRDLQISVLRQMIIELQRHKAYQPVKDDPIDLALAQYIRNRSSTLIVPFVREDRGVYLFGTRRVFMKLEKGRLIIRVGGGYMLIDEFVNVYTPIEMEKIDQQRGSPSKQTERGESPVRGNIEKSVFDSGKIKLSPEKAAKLVKDTCDVNSTGFKSVVAVPKRPSSRRPSAKRQRRPY